MKDSYKFWALILSGFLTLIMTAFIPDSGGGAAMVFFVTVPFFIVLGIVLAFVYRLISKKVNDDDIKGIVFSLLLFILMALNIMAYPF
ncbi:MAG: NhaP-type Na+/H+ or K+/H+ antiporter [Psychroserpens sp.]|jgi:NhaP-type Na+/H+ or K+/H+ antiporter|tara:strand:- start:997 stop:1260 length:264 start_codon:yes stop_codon:yes gene_type:complete